MKAPFVQFYFEGRPVFVPLYVQSVTELPIVRAGKTPMLELRSGKYNVDCAVCVDPHNQTAIVYSVSTEGNIVTFSEI